MHSGLTLYVCIQIHKLSLLLNIQHLELPPRLYAIEKPMCLTLKSIDLGQLQQLHPELWSPVSQPALRDACSELPPLLGAEHWASPYSPFRDQETVSGSICTKIDKVLSLTSFKNGDILIALFHHPPQYTKHFTNEEISASACALLLSVVKKTTSP